MFFRSVLHFERRKVLRWDVIRVQHRFAHHVRSDSGQVLLLPVTVMMSVTGRNTTTSDVAHFQGIYPSRMALFSSCPYMTPKTTWFLSYSITPL